MKNRLLMKCLSVALVWCLLGGSFDTVSFAEESKEQSEEEQTDIEETFEGAVEIKTADELLSFTEAYKKGNYDKI